MAGHHSSGNKMVSSNKPKNKKKVRPIPAPKGKKK